MTKPPAAPLRARTAWLLHGLLLLAVLGAFFALVAAGSSRTSFALAFAFGFVPGALAYTVISTAVFIPLRRRWWGVLLAHGAALAAAVGAVLFFVKGD